MPFPRCLSLPVLFVLSLLLSIFFTVVFAVIDPWLGLTTAPGIFHLLLFSALTGMALLSYSLAVIRDPGAVPSQYMPDVEGSQAAILEVKRKGRGGDPRFCQKCNHYKPPRAHHCRVCKRCVLKMDHHCVWINNCVGHGNHKAFFLFLSYVVSALAHAFCLTAVQTGYSIGALGDVGGVLGHIPWAACFILVTVLLLALGMLLMWHVYLLLNNKTTIEYYEGVRATWLARKAGDAYRHPYDLGFLNNLVVIMGPKIVCWMCPTSGLAISDGLRFRSRYDHSDTQAHALY